MRALRRGARNLWRNPIRAVLVSGIVAVAVAAAATLGAAARDLGARTDDLAGAWQNLIEVRAAGATGMGVGADALSEPALLEPAGQIAGVARVERYLFQRVSDPAQPVPIQVFVGMVPGQTPRVANHGEVGQPELVSGRWLRPADAGAPVAVVGQTYAQMYGLGVGDRFTVEAARVLAQDRVRPRARIQPVTLEVVGVFDADFTFGNAQVFLPLDVAQDAFDQPGRVTHLWVTAQSAAGVATIETDLRTAYGDIADVISGQRLVENFVGTLAQIQTTSVTSALFATIAGILVIAVTMALVSAERTREIGVLKTLGAPSSDLVRQFVAEATVLAASGAGAGLALFAAAGPTLGDALLAGRARDIPAMTALGEDPLSAIGVRATLDSTSLWVTAGLVVIAAALASLYPLWRAVRLSPAEAIRHG